MVVSVPSKSAQALYAIAVVTAIAMMVVTGSPLLLDYMVASSWPGWVYWAAAGFVVVGAVPTYWALMPIGAAQVLRSQTE